MVGKATIEFPDAPPPPDPELEPTLAPETPTGLAGSLRGGAVTLTWNTVAGATSYELSVLGDAGWIDSNHPVFTGNTNPDRGSLTARIADGRATVFPFSGWTYDFRVRAVNNIGKSDWSEAATVDTWITEKERRAG